MIRVLVVAPLYHTDRGGLGRQAVLLTEKLAELGVAMSVATRKMRGLPSRRWSPRVKIFKIPAPRPGVHNYEKPNLENLITSLAFALGLDLFLIRHARAFDAIHVHGASLPVLALLPVAKLLRIPVLAKVAATHQGVEAGDLKRRYGPIGPVLAWLFAQVDGYVATTAEIEQVLQADGVPRARIARIPNFVDVDLFRPLPPEERSRVRRALGFDGRVVLIASGRLTERKNNDVLLRAFARVRTGESLLVLLGDGPERSKLEELARALGLGREAVRFEGFREDVPRWLGAADGFVLASRIEGFPNSLLESMSAGLACIATRIGGGEEAVTDGETGILVRPDDQEDLADALLRLLREPELRARLGEAAARTTRARYALDAVAPRYPEVYRALKAGREVAPKARAPASRGPGR